MTTLFEYCNSWLATTVLAWRYFNKRISLFVIRFDTNMQGLRGGGRGVRVEPVSNWQGNEFMQCDWRKHIPKFEKYTCACTNIKYHLLQKENKIFVNSSEKKVTNGLLLCSYDSKNDSKYFASQLMYWTNECERNIVQTWVQYIYIFSLLNIYIYIYIRFGFVGYKNFW
jgi:hypothetical protein